MTSDAEGPRGRGSPYQLPGLLAEIAEVAGLSAALAIAQVRGGTRPHFPASCPDDHWLVGAVGREAADKLCRHFSVNYKGGMSLALPLGPTKLYDRARFRALQLLAEGRSIADTAREIGVSTRAIEKWGAMERKRLAERRAGKARQAQAGTAELTRPYDPVRDGLVSRLAEPAPAGGGSGPSPPTEGGNAPPLPAIDIAALPSLLAEIAEVAGIGAATVVGIMKGGRVLQVTDHAGHGGELARLVGPRSAEKLRAHYRAKHAGDIALFMPRCTPDLLNALAEWTLELRDGGCAAGDVADWLGITPQVVDHLCAAARASVGSGFSFRSGFPYFTTEPKD